MEGRTVSARNNLARSAEWWFPSAFPPTQSSYRYQHGIQNIDKVGLVVRTKIWSRRICCSSYSICCSAPRLSIHPIIVALRNIKRRRRKKSLQNPMVDRQLIEAEYTQCDQSRGCHTGERTVALAHRFGLILDYTLQGGRS